MFDRADDVSVCHVSLDVGLVTLENDRIRREYRWIDGDLIGTCLLDKTTNRPWPLVGVEPDMALPGTGSATGGDLTVTHCPTIWFRPAHVQVDVDTHFASLTVRRRFRIYPGCPAIACDVYLRATSDGAWGGGDAAVTERLCLEPTHVQLEGVQFFDITDHRNTLVVSRSILPYRRRASLPANLLVVRDILSADHDGLFILKEAPSSDVQLAGAGTDFVTRTRDEERSVEISMIGVGIEPEEVSHDSWVRGYGFVTGVSTGGEFGSLKALRAYQDRVRVHEADRDEMILLNTWGDRGKDTRLSEEFALAELDCAAALGVTHFQLDDGWQAGRTSNSAYEGGSLENIWDDADFWSPHPERFPNGLGPVAARAEELGIQLCLWFNPSKDRSYAHWREDADTLIELNREHGICTFKIDGVMVPDKHADVNLRAMFERVMDATDGRAMFNLDVTAGRRWGYHYGNEYGNIFLENRYTDWGNYYPHWTLRNLWMLSRYVPTQNLQIEFLNKWRNVDRYPPEDPLSPHRVPFDYCFAITMMAQPLAWFEASGLPEEAFDLAHLIRTYRTHMVQIHSGCVLPIGDEPNGTSWTGFQSIGGDDGYVVVYRELNPRSSAIVRLWDLAEETVRFDAVVGHGTDFGAVVGPAGEVEFSLPESLSFALYRYEKQGHS